MPLHWHIRAKYLDPKTGQVLYSPDVRSVPKSMGQAVVARGDWEFVEEFEAPGRADGTGGKRGPVPVTAVTADKIPPRAPKKTVAPIAPKE